MAPVFVRPEQINDRLADQAGLLEVDLCAKAVPGLSVHQGDDSALVVLAHHGVTLQVAYSALLINHRRALLNAHAAFDRAASLAPTAVAFFAWLLAAQVLGQIASGLLVQQDALVWVRRAATSVESTASVASDLHANERAELMALRRDNRQIELKWSISAKACDHGLQAEAIRCPRHLHASIAASQAIAFASMSRSC